jgi:hypothetical protein
MWKAFTDVCAKSVCKEVGFAIFSTRGTRLKVGPATTTRIGRIAASDIEHRKSSQRSALRVNSALGRGKGSQTPTPCPAPRSPLKRGANEVSCRMLE